MKFKDLKSYISTLNDEQLECDVTVYQVNEGEGYRAIGFGKADEVIITTELSADSCQSVQDDISGLFDKGHPVILFEV